MRVSTSLASIVLTTLLASSVSAQFQPVNPDGGALGQSKTQRWKTGVICTAASGACSGIVATIPVPVDWPEQKVTIVEEDITTGARVMYRMVEGTVKEMVVTIPFVPGGREVKALVTMEVTRHAQIPPDETDIFEIPNSRTLPRPLRPFVGGSPGIETTNSKIRKLSKEIGVEEETAWACVEAIYDWVRDNVEYKEGPFKGAMAALRDGEGDCEELTSLFIAICRAGDIPARTVWIPGHCYPEFYLVDAEGEGHWFPCQAAGSRAFGGIPEYRPILQKGDNFRSASNPRERVRYRAESLIGQGGKPKVRFVRELMPN